jgi:ectoine hydroxylase-related dioxygenase (phytanoyl-CoA dioxygenase family)
MNSSSVLSHAPKVLTEEQRKFYFENGYLLLEGFLSDEWLTRLNALSEKFVEESRGWKASDDKFDLEDGHSPDTPRLRRLTQPVEHHPTYWELASNSPITDVAEDLLGPDVKFHHSKLNFKWSRGGTEVKWHQDIQFYPHTNYNVLAIGIYLEDVDDTMGPMGVVPGSHEGELFNLYSQDDQWTGAIDDRDLARVPLEKAVYLKGPAGSVTVHHCRTVHGSKPNAHPTKARPLLLNSFSAANALTVTPNPSYSRHNGALVRGNPARWVEFDPRPCLLPPDWSGGYTSIFALQQEEAAQQ